MHSLARKLMVSRQLSFEEDGEGQVLGSRVFMINRDFLLELENSVDEETVKELGELSGRNLADMLSERGLDGSKAVNFAMNMLTMFGLGKFEVGNFDIAEKEAKIRVDNCATVGADIDCVFIEGILSGVFTEVFSEEHEFREIACRNKDAEICQFTNH